MEPDVSLKLDEEYSEALEELFINLLPPFCKCSNWFMTPVEQMESRDELLCETDDLILDESSLPLPFAFLLKVYFENGISSSSSSCTIRSLVFLSCFFSCFMLSFPDFLRV